MMKTNAWLAPILPILPLLLIVLAVGGCGKPDPDLVKVRGVVLLKGKPLNHAEVRFIPLQEGLDGNFVGIGVTDDTGHFVLEFPGKAEGGACVGKNKVLVSEGPVPGDARDETEAGEKKYRAYKASLKNRPIPHRYSNISDSPIIIEVTPEKTDYKIELN